MEYNKEQRESLIKESIGKTIIGLEWDSEDKYWIMEFNDGSEMSFRFMAELNSYTKPNTKP